MRYIGLLMVLAIIYIAYTRMASTPPAKSEIAQSMQEAGAAAGSPAPGASATPHTDALKAPLDQTRAVLDQVRKQKSADEF